jgi:hypothetical protein
MGRHEVLTSPANPLLKDVGRAMARVGLTDEGYVAAYRRRGARFLRSKAAASPAPISRSEPGSGAALVVTLLTKSAWKVRLYWLPV